MARIAVGGFQHETNTFAPVKADLAAFERVDGWPGLTRGRDLFDVFTGINIPLAGFLDTVDRRAHEIIPLAWASATPSAEVTSEAFDTVCGLLVEGLRGAGPLDAVYLDLHGAMVSEAHADGEGEILRRVRGAIGDRVPLVASLDLHANVSAAMVERADLMIAYREYPHIDMAETGARAAAALEDLLRGAPLPRKAFRQIPFLVPITSQCTFVEPALGLKEAVAAAEAAPVRSVSLSWGFPPADFADCGPSVLAYGDEPGPLIDALDSLCARIEQAEPEFAGTFHTPDEAIAIAAAAPGRGPMLLADTQDNPGGGGNADTVGLLAALLRHDLPGSAIGVLFDPDVAAQAHAAGEGATIDVRIGAKSGFPGEEPLAWRFSVERLGDGDFVAPGPFFGGARVRLGPMAALRSGNVRVVVASRKQQAADGAMFRHVGVEPAGLRILALKSSVHFRADLEPLARGVLVVVSPGPNVADPARLDYRRLRPGVRRGPLGAASEESPAA